MKKYISLLLACLLLAGCAAATVTPASTEAVPTEEVPVMADPVSDNYRTYYQIFVGSFSDSNNDGLGDLRGIINRMDYLNDGNIRSGKSLGIQGIWLSPIFSSPSYHKYDVKDYYSVDWRFGTEEDLKELIALCKARNVQLILDLVINHTSKEHPWFLEFKKARAEGDTENPYYDYYSCATEEGKLSGVTYQKIAGSDYWYECNFSGDMPELNFDNEAVRQEVLKIARHYLDLGVSGFRFDAVKYIYFGDTMRSVAFWEWYMEQLREIKPDIYCVGECWSGDTEVLEYYGAMNCFNFTMAQAEGIFASAAKGGTMSTFAGYMESFQKKVLEQNEDGMVMPFLSNHDMDRIGGSFILENNMRMAANLYLLSPGSPMIYYGEETGLRGSRGGEMTDANRRLAMRWGDDDHVRDPQGATYPAKNQIQTTVADQLADENSLLSYYSRLIALRHKYPAIARGSYTAINCSKNLGGFRIAYGEETLGLLHNNGTAEVSYDLSKLKKGTFSEVCDFIGMGSASLNGTVLTVGPQTSVILK